MRFKNISINNGSKGSVYNKKQKEVLETISEKMNSIGLFFDKIAEVENLILKNIYADYINLIRIRENREEIEKIGGAEMYLKDYFLKTVNDIEEGVSVSIETWNTENKDFTTDIIKEKIEKIKQLKLSIKEKCKHESFIKNICEILDMFGHFKIYKIFCLHSTLDRIELLISFKDELIETVESDNIVETIKNKKLSIDDL